MVPEEIKENVSLNSFKEFIKMWVAMHCPCRLCTDYLDGIGFISTIENNLPLKTCSTSIITLIVF